MLRSAGILIHRCAVASSRPTSTVLISRIRRTTETQMAGASVRLNEERQACSSPAIAFWERLTAEGCSVTRSAFRGGGMQADNNSFDHTPLKLLLLWVEPITN